MMHFLRFLFSRTFLLNVIIAISIIASGLYFTLEYLDDYALHSQTLEVPDLEGKNFHELDSFAMQSGFTPLVSDSLYLADKEAGIILEQDPRAGKTVKQGRKIYVTIAASLPPQVTMPDLVDLSLRQASSLMETYGLLIGDLSYKPDLCMNCILEQKQNGQKIEPGLKIRRGSSIDLVVGQGLSKELTPVPYLVGINQEMARSVLQAAYLNIGVVSFDESVKNSEDSALARVYKQYPFYSDEPSVNMGSSVDLFLTVDTNRIVHTVNPADSI